MSYNELSYGLFGSNHTINGVNTDISHTHTFCAEGFKIDIETLNRYDGLVFAKDSNFHINVVNIKSAKIELPNDLTICLEKKILTQII